VILEIMNHGICFFLAILEREKKNVGRRKSSSYDRHNIRKEFPITKVVKAQKSLSALAVYTIGIGSYTIAYSINNRSPHTIY
jgi:hypothetical protein